LCEETHGGWSYALLEGVDDTPLEKIRPCDTQKLIKPLKFRKECGIYGIQNECLKHLPRRPLVHLTHLFNHYLLLSYFSKSWKDAEIMSLPTPAKNPEFTSDKLVVQ
jgi:hypothetical protein